ncbi:uncharacterized protein TNCV_3839551 [Trichonephila clavipes]|nr:uncharacterized protein TNCV_3839551 [Trichonephila clavipes]
MDVHYKENVSVFKIECCSQLNENLTQFWKLESRGISDTEKNMLDSDNDYISSFENNLKFNNGMYETKLIWEDKPSDLENNWALEKCGFNNLNIKMQDNNWLYNEYINIVKDQIKENIVEECSPHFKINSYYMPHSAVVRKDKETTKVRMVFDASSKGRNCKSLNECLYAGPPLNPRIIDIKGKASNYKQFVSNRVIEIQSNSDPSDWHHCSRRENPADYVSRGANLETIINSEFWMHGPQWLRTTENNWSKNLNCGFSSTDPCVQVTAPLLALHVEQSASFSAVGIDFGGPLYTKDENKHYIVLFTCAITRALHLELVNNLTTETFLLALRRIISRRGLRSKILTDNAKTFKKSELELKNLWKIISDPTVEAFYASHKIYGQFIIERAPWWGGFYERLIRTVKLAL